MYQQSLAFHQQEIYANIDFINAINDTCDQEWLSERNEYWSERSNYEKTILSLFDYSGNWSLPYAKAGYNVVCIDIKHGMDINDFSVEYLTEELGLDDVYGIIAGVPCTEYAVSGARWWVKKDANGQTEKSNELMYQTIRTIEFYNPMFWSIENPVGRIPRLFEELNVKPWYFNPCDFGKGYEGEDYTKKTGLWGVFTPPSVNNLGSDRSVFPHQGSKMHKLYGGKSERTKELRSITPMGFSNAFFECNQ